MRIVVVVTFNVPDLITAQAQTLRAWLVADPENRLVVVDNSGSQATVDTVRSITADVADRVIAFVNPRNAGFAPAVNAAVERAESLWGTASAIGLLNPDVSTDAETLAAVFERLDDASVGIAAPLLLDLDGAPDRGSLRRYWNRRRLFAEVVGRPAVARMLGSLPRSIAPSSGRPHVDVDITSGAFMAIRRAVFAGGLDVRLPMYLEDQEICHRARRLGWAVRVDTSLTAAHVGGHSRRTHTAMTRPLRLMELATAPALSWIDVSGAPRHQARIVVGAAATLRTITAAAVLAASVVAPARREWAASQVRLGTWLMAWSADPRGLDTVTWESS